MIQEATTACDAVLVAAAGPAIDELVDVAPLLRRGDDPRRALPRHRPGVATFGVEATLVTRASYPEETVYAHRAGDLPGPRDAAGLDPVLADLDPSVMVRDGLAAPLHPGAARFYREQGWID